MRMNFRSTLLIGLIITTYSASAQDYEVPRTEWGAPDFQAVWKHSSIIPFERPRELMSGPLANIFCSTERCWQRFLFRRAAKPILMNKHGLSVVGLAFFEQVFEVSFAPLWSRGRRNQLWEIITFQCCFRFERLGRNFGAQQKNNRKHHQNYARYRVGKTRNA